MTEYGDASALFSLHDDVVIFLNDVLMPISPVIHEHNGATATWIDFEARSDDGAELIGSLYTTQCADEVCELVDQALEEGKPLEICARRGTVTVPGTLRSWVFGTISVGKFSPTLPPAVMPDVAKLLN
ncbi:hypothetical protein J5277_16390 [Rhizobium sp. 16-449-1b]|uniref:hypothetical protein n=1 Tax=Rhizobium sp. 16-449-1b TaxID=2819989 RepID=UPI001AD96CE4|nr:hypothetical protein [Rhizobium sp. 16-449-1b]MBO9195686.1 hypothetical protein [Rhizobium sp. 16-449-1b]